MNGRVSTLWRQLGAWRQRQRARRQELRRQRREQQRALWGGPVEADRVLAFSDAVFAIAASSGSSPAWTTRCWCATCCSSD